MPHFLDAVILARIQFAFVVTFHILFPAFTIGLASWLAVIEWKYLRTNDEKYRQIYQMWIKIFAVCFGVGVVTGVVMSYQFGTNWSLFSNKVGNVIGPLLGYEVLTAFFLEASFLGIMLFGWGKVSKKMHFVSTCIVAVGTLISAFWILAANSWMHTPQGFEIGEDGIFYPTSWLDIIFNPSFFYRFPHMVIGAYLTTAFVVGGVGAHYILKKKHIAHAKIMLSMALIMAIFVAPIQAFIGDMHGLNTLHYQPRKIAAMEGIWETEKGAGLRLFAVPDQENEKNDFELEIPKLGSLILTHKIDGEIKGLKEWDKSERPPVIPVFFAFRIMVGLGVAMILTGVMGAILYYKKTLFQNRLFLHWCRLLTPAGFFAVVAGWFVTEIGRQPYTVYGFLHTANSISPVRAEAIFFSLCAFMIVYSVIFGSAIYYVMKTIKKGPVFATKHPEENIYDHTQTHTFAKTLKGDKNA